MIKQATLDLLDSELRNETSNFKSLSYTNRLKLFTFGLRIDPLRSQEYFDRISANDLKWNEPIKYSSKPNLDNIIKDNEVGIYLFVVEPEKLILNMPKYVLYVGISGANDSQRPLRERLKDYFYYEKIKKRTNIHQMLGLYYENIYIYYAYFDNINKNIEDVETALHEFFSPHFARKAFELETRKAANAWQ